MSVRCSVESNSLLTLWNVAIGLLCPFDSPGKSTGVGCHFLLQEIFPIKCWEGCKVNKIFIY